MTEIREYTVLSRTKKLNDGILAVQPEMCTERARFITQAYKESEAVAIGKGWI